MKAKCVTTHHKRILYPQCVSNFQLAFFLFSFIYLPEQCSMLKEFWAGDKAGLERFLSR